MDSTKRPRNFNVHWKKLTDSFKTINMKSWVKTDGLKNDVFFQLRKEIVSNFQYKHGLRKWIAIPVELSRIRELPHSRRFCEYNSSNLVAKNSLYELEDGFVSK